MLATLSDKIAAQGITNVRPLLLDLHSKDCPQQFDLIFSAMTLHHIDEVELILGKIVEGLKPGGILALADLDSEDGSFHRDNPTGVMHHGFDRAQLTAALRRLGLKSITVDTVHTIMKTDGQGEKTAVSGLPAHRGEGPNMNFPAAVLPFPEPCCRRHYPLNPFFEGERYAVLF